MITTILFDIYGMIVFRKIRFSQRFSEEFRVPIEKLTPFFRNEFQLCLTGKADLKNELKKHLLEWGWKESTEKLLQYWFEHDKDIEGGILDSVEKLRKNRIKCFLNTQNEKYITHYAFETLGLKKYFDGIFSTNKIGYTKSQKEYWQKIYEKLGKPNKKSVLCWDDEEKNIQSAKNFGFLAELYTDFNNYKNKINDIIK